MAGLRLVPTSGAPIDIDRDSTLVGRDPSCDLVVSDGSVSRRHARVERRGEGWAVVDQGSANGTFIDSQRVIDTALRSGQELRFGAVAYRVEIEGDEDDTAATIVGGMPEATVIQEGPLFPPRGTSSPPPPSAPPPLPSAVRPTAATPPPLPPRTGAAPPPPPPPPPRMAGPPPVTGGFGASPVPPMAPPAAGPKKGRSPLVWVGVGCCGCLVAGLALFAVIGGAAFFATRGVVDAVRAQLAEIKAGNVDAAYNRMSEGYRQSHSAAEFAAFVDRHPAMKDNADSTFTTRNIQNDRAHLEGFLVSGSGTRETVTYELVREGGNWLVEDVKFDGESAATASGGGAGGGGSGGGNEGTLEIETLDLRKEAASPGMRVAITVRVTGFSVRPDGDAFRMDLIEDLETLGPGGQKLPSLSRLALQTLRERTTQATGASAEFTNNLNFVNPAPGRYVARLTIRDEVGKNLRTHEVPFELP